MNSVARHFREKPPEWDVLSVMSAQIAGSRLLGVEKPRALYEAIDGEFTDEQLDENNYFALGHAMCELSSLLQEPPCRHAVGSTAYGILARFVLGRSYRTPGGLNINFVPSRELGPNGSISSAFWQPSCTAIERAEAAQPGFKLLGDTLSQVVVDRAARNKAFPRVWRYADPREPFVRILQGGLLASQMTWTSTTSTTGIIYKALIAKQMELTSQSCMEIIKANPLMHTILGNLSLRDLVLRKTANRLAITRIDVCGAWIDGDAIDVNKRKELTFNAPEPLPEKNADVLHEMPLICPAHTVEALIPQVFDISINALEMTDEYLRKLHTPAYAVSS